MSVRLRGLGPESTRSTAALRGTQTRELFATRTVGSDWLRGRKPTAGRSHRNSTWKRRERKRGKCLSGKHSTALTKVVKSPFILGHLIPSHVGGPLWLWRLEQRQPRESQPAENAKHRFFFSLESLTAKSFRALFS